MPNYILPFPLDIMNDPFGNRFHPIDRVWRWHNGADFGANRGAPIANIAGGEVIHSGPNAGEGISVHVRHDDGTVSKGFHMSSAAVRFGDRVERGQTLGYVGSTGASTGPHYHLEIWVDGHAVDPVAFILAHAGTAAPEPSTLTIIRKAKMFILIFWKLENKVYLWNLAPGMDGRRATYVSPAPEPDYDRLTAMFGQPVTFDSQDEWEKVRVEYSLGN